MSEEVTKSDESRDEVLLGILGVVGRNTEAIGELAHLVKDQHELMERIRAEFGDVEEAAGLSADEDYESFEQATVLAFGNWVLDFLGLTDEGDATLRVKLARRQLVASLSRGMPEVVMGPEDMLGEGYDLFDDHDLEQAEEELGVEPVQLTAE